LFHEAENPYYGKYILVSLLQILEEPHSASPTGLKEILNLQSQPIPVLPAGKKAHGAMVE